MNLYPPESRSPEHRWITIAPPTREDETVEKTFGRVEWGVCARCGVVGKKHKAPCKVQP